MLTNDHPALSSEWHAICRVPDSGRVTSGRLLGSRYVAAATDGGLLVSLDACPHRGGRLSDGTLRDGCLRCPYHGWRFAADGSCTAIPAIGDSPIPSRADLVVVPHEVALGLVWIRGDHGSEGFEPLDVPEWGAPGIGHAWLPDTTMACSAGQFIDNFLDIAHFPVVHDGTFGADEADEVPDLEVEVTGDRTARLRHSHTIVNREDPLVATGDHPLVQPRVMEYTVRVPFSARLRIELPLTGVDNTIVVVASPIDADTSALFCILLRNDLGGAPDDPDGSRAAQEAVDYELAVLAEDLAVLEHLADQGLVIDLPAQVHTRADRFTVEYRRLLARLIG